MAKLVEGAQGKGGKTEFKSHHLIYPSLISLSLSSTLDPNPQPSTLPTPETIQANPSVNARFRGRSLSSVQWIMGLLGR